MADVEKMIFTDKMTHILDGNTMPKEKRREVEHYLRKLKHEHDYIYRIEIEIFLNPEKIKNVKK